MARHDRLIRNRAIAEKFYEGYHGSVERGHLSLVFDPDDFADQWVFCSPFLGGESSHGKSRDLAEGAVLNHSIISARVPDYKMDDFRAWPTEAGCAWRWRVNGHGLDGELVEFWEQLFLWIDDEGLITRFEFYDDWHGFAQGLIYAYDTTLDAFSGIAGYGASPWTSGGTMALTTPGTPPREDPPATDRSAGNLALAQRCFDAYRSSPDASWLDAVHDDLTEECVLFSPWTGEQSIASGQQDTVAIGHPKIRERFPDLRVKKFEAWPTDDGCAWRWGLEGTGAGGVRYELWQQVFIDTDPSGKVTRVESYFDWQGFPQMIGYVTGIPLDELWDSSSYEAWLTA